MKIGLCVGCFDDFHSGHEYFLTEASKHCKLLIIGLNVDTSVRALKGVGRPYYEFDKRAYALDDWLQTNSCLISSIIPFDGDDRAFVQFFRPHVIIRGWDQAPGDKLFGIPIVRIGRGPPVSTTLRNNERS